MTGRQRPRACRCWPAKAAGPSPICGCAPPLRHRRSRLDVAGGRRHDVVVIPGFHGVRPHHKSRLRRSLQLAPGSETPTAGAWGAMAACQPTWRTLDRQWLTRWRNGRSTASGSRWSAGAWADVVAREYAKRVSCTAWRKRHHPRQPLFGAARAPTTPGGSMNAVARPQGRRAADRHQSSHEKPPVPTYRLLVGKATAWSPRNAARGRSGEADHATELACSHMAFVSDPEAIRAIARAIIA
jgi:hypothetical protein